MSTSTYVMTKMGLMKKKSSVDPKYCRPQGLYSSHNLNLKKLKKLIVAGKLAPCYPGQEGAEVAAEAGSDGDIASERGQRNLRGAGLRRHRPR